MSSFIWDGKNNFILLHFIVLHEQQSSSIENIDWSEIAKDIHLEISSTPTLLKKQYEYLLETFYPKQDANSLHATLKRIYLHSLCQKIENGSEVTLETVYELVRHARAKRININDIKQLLTEWNFNYSSDEQKKNKERLLNILKRLDHYIYTLSNLSEQSSTNELLTVQQGKVDPDLEPVSDSEDGMPMISKQNESIDIDDNQWMSNTNVQNKPPSFTRRRTRSLTIFPENKHDQVNIGVEWFVPKFKRQQRSASLHAQDQSIPPINSSSIQQPNLQSNTILLTTIDNDESSNSTSNSHIQPSVSWLPLTTEQTIERERQKSEVKFIDDQQLDQVSSTDSESIEVEWSSRSAEHKMSASSFSRHDQQQNSLKRRRFS